MHQSFLPGFDDLLPFVLVDVELDEQADLRTIGRLLDGPDAPLRDRRRGSRSPSRTSRPASPCPRSSLEHRMSGRFAASDQVAIVGYAQSPVVRHADKPLGALALDTARAGDRRRRPRGRADRRLHHRRALPDRRRAHDRGRRQHRQRQLAGRAPRRRTRATATGFQGFGQIPGSVALAVNAVASGAADYVLLHRALHNPVGKLPRQPDARGARLDAVDRTAGLLRPAGDDRAAVQRVPPALRRVARGDGRGRGRGAQERGPHPVVVLARQAADRRGLPRPRR